MAVFSNRVVVLKIVTLYHILVLINARDFFVKSKKEVKSNRFSEKRGVLSGPGNPCEWRRPEMRIS